MRRSVTPYDTATRSRPALRIALYSHDTMGLGHFRRNLAIARSLSRLRPVPHILLLTGAREAGLFPLPAGTDLVSLPVVHKDARGTYAADNLGVSLSELTDLRSCVLDATIAQFAPDVLVVDKVALGLAGELAGTLQRLASDASTRIVLGLRDVLDDPATVRREWADDETLAAIERFYDAVWVYGDRRVYDLVEELGMPRTCADKVTFTGYLAPGNQTPGNQTAGNQTAGARSPVEGRFDLCVLGGGQDGHAVAEAFLQAEHPDDVTPVVLAGPHMDRATRARLHRRAAAAGGLIVDFTTDVETWLARARRVVAMAGYNTTMELLATATPALLVPRVRPRIEQWIRAQRLAELGLVDLCHPDDLDPDTIGAWLLAEPTGLARARGSDRIDLAAAHRLPRLVTELVTARSTTTEDVHHAA